MNNFERDEILSIIGDWTYESPDNTVFDRNADALTFGDGKNPMIDWLGISAGRFSG